MDNMVRFTGVREEIVLRVVICQLLEGEVLV